MTIISREIDILHLEFAPLFVTKGIPGKVRHGASTLLFLELPLKFHGPRLGPHAPARGREDSLVEDQNQDHTEGRRHDARHDGDAHGAHQGSLGLQEHALLAFSNPAALVVLCVQEALGLQARLACLQTRADGVVVRVRQIKQHALRKHHSQERAYQQGNSLRPRLDRAVVEHRRGQIVPPPDLSLDIHPQVVHVLDENGRALAQNVLILVFLCHAAAQEFDFFLVFVPDFVVLVPNLAPHAH
mmetsp:Transcript_19315/g.35867  ORF Transcript_19315/g.35867 Transcript_19315/m.35867 type:complete len:243 (-) Transcript_19315:3632-4360(-)